MKWFYDLKIAKKLMLSFSVILVLLSALGGFSLIQLDKVNDVSSALATNWLPSIRTLANIKLTLSRTRSFELQYITATTPERATDAKNAATKMLAELAKQQKLYETQISEEEEKKVYPTVEREIQTFIEEHAKIFALLGEGKKEEALQLLNGTSTSAYRKAIGLLEQLVTVNENGAIESNQLASTTYANAKLMIGSFLVMSIALALSLAAWLARIVSRPLTEALDIAQRVADGDLTASIDSHSKDETGQLMLALKAMNDNLQRIVGEVRTSTDSINTASGEIAAGNLDLSSRTEEQAGSLEETASAMEQMTSTVKQNADNARQANTLAESASNVAVEGGLVVNKVVSTMDEINASSRKIVDIISVIDSIAFQTNILALNAAVEAARAGEQGRGFAVVASEVRTLAQRSATAAKEIKSLIDTSVAKVDDGSRLVAQAGTTMDEVVASVKRVTDIVAEISSASAEQSAGIDEINRAITQMDEVTQQNAALVEQAAAAAQSLQDQAGNLLMSVSIFKLNSTNGVSVPADKLRQRSIDISPKASRLSSAAVKNLPVKQKAISSSSNSNNGSWETF
jgi:methyl-accepting chemotaxis protein